ncbi:MAG: hypothetical protein NBV62_00040 [Sandarakinorhabdus limnophila]|nr:hypothetical protein [Sandarakinorhabdus limnophila]MCM0031345.1 hypothetical protein [Sandarakinorhabdus limnophila]
MIAFVLQPGKALLQLVIKFNNTRFNGLVEPADASANGIDLGLEFLAASGNGVILCGRPFDKIAKYLLDPMRHEDPVGHALEHHSVELRHRQVTAFAVLPAFLMAARTAVIAVATTLTGCACARHSSLTGCANCNASQQSRAIDDAGRGNPGVVLREPSLHPFEQIKRNDHRNIDLDDGRGVMQFTGTRAANAVRPFAGSIAPVGQDAVHRPDAKGGALAGAVAMLI